ncbi:MAG: glycosyltransferase [Gemmatimonadetes bacterium]|nr:glycosyltransferase [Gemmatimonadota bacterium]
MDETRPVVAHFVGKIYLKASENWIYRQVRALETVRSIFLAKRRQNSEAYPWEPVYTLDALPTPNRVYNQLAGELVGYFPFHRAACRRGRVRLLHAHFGLNAIRGLPLARALRVPMLVSFYGRDMYHHRDGASGLRRSYRRVFAEGAGFIAEGPAAREQLVRIGCPPEKIHIHRLGIDLSEIPVSLRYIGAGTPVRVLMAARFTEKKGLPYGVEAFCRVAATDSRLHLTIVGEADASDAEQRIRQQIHALVARSGVASRVRFAGFLSNAELHALAREHHLFVHPSIRAAQGDAEGGHPVVITEMAAAGMPVIATRHCDIPEVVVDRQTGWLCEERSVEQLAAALREALAKPDLIPDYGAAGRKLVEEKYDARRNTLDPVYAEYLSGSR